MGYTVEVAAAPAGFAGKIRAQGYEVHAIPFSRNPLSLKNVVAYHVLRQLMRSRHYAVVHMHTPVAGFLGRLAARREDVPHILYTAHGFHFHRRGNRWSNYLYYTLERVASRWTDTLITINKDDYAVASRRFASGLTHVAYVPGVGVDCQKCEVSSATSRGAARSFLGLSMQEYVVAWVGELNQNKRPQDVLAAVHELRKTQRVRVFMLGGGRRSQEIMNRAVCDNLNEIVSLLGRVSNVSEYLSASDVLVSTSMREGLPRNIIEAMAAGLPVVAYNIRGCNDLVIDGETGFLVPFGDVHGLADKLAWLAQHPDERRHMGEAGRRRVEETFSLEAVLPQMMTVYRSELEREAL
jgi:glycosyltransferase involved in cell wall biosynthesis